MTKKRFLEFGLLGVMFAAVIVGFATRQSPKKVTPSTYSFYYYPKANVYFNTTENNYIFPDENGNWKVAKDLPQTKSYVLDKKVDMNSSSIDIWKENEKHRMVHAVSLYASESDLKQPPVERYSPAPAASKSDTISRKEEPKKQDGIKGFFKKIFKKKKDEPKSI